jgi:hypothetical protein
MTWLNPGYADGAVKSEVPLVFEIFLAQSQPKAGCRCISYPEQILADG